VAKRKAIDRFRRDRTLGEKYSQLGAELGLLRASEGPEELDGWAEEEAAIDDDRLRLIFVACHPVLSPPARVALTLRLVGGLTVPEIARAYVVAETTIAQRIVRAKKTIAQSGVPFEVPAEEDRAARLHTVLEVLYLIFNEGYAATAGHEWMRPELCHEALRLGRVLTALTPEAPEVHGLVALMEFQSSRLRARVGPSGEPVLLLEQDRRSWDRLHIGRGEAALGRAERHRGAEGRGPYQLQAAIAACHAHAFHPDETDWGELVDLYTELARTMPSPIVELNRAVAVSMSTGPADALALVDVLVATGTLERYHLLAGVRGDLLEQLGRHAEAADEFERAAGLTANEAERALLTARAASSRETALRTGSPRGRAHRRRRVRRALLRRLRRLPRLPSSPGHGHARRRNRAGGSVP